MAPQDLEEAARGLVEAARARQVSVAVAESLTGGMVASAIVAVPGASAVLAGAVVAYSTRVKSQVLGADPERLRRVGPVDAAVAEQMAAGVSRLMGAKTGLATTGVAGPGPADGHPPGTVHVAVSAPWGVVRRQLSLPGGRGQVRCATALEVLRLATAFLDDSPSL